MDHGNSIQMHLEWMERMLQQVLRNTEELVRMVADSNRNLTALQTEMPSMEERLSTQLASLEEGLNRERLIREVESRLFAHAIGELQRDVSILKQR